MTWNSSTGSRSSFYWRSVYMKTGYVKLSDLLPVLEWLPRYRSEWLPSDLIAGLTASAVVIPKAMAYATIAGLPVEVGLYVAFLPMLIYVFMGTSRVLSVSSTSTIAILVAAELSLVTDAVGSQWVLEVAAMLAFLSGVFLFLAGVLHLGFIANFISSPVLTGFKSGIGLVIILDQVPKLIGIHIEKAGFFRDILSILYHVSETVPATLCLSVFMIALLVFFKHSIPKAPGPLFAVITGIVLSFILGLDRWGVELIGVVQAGLPVLKMPDLSLSSVLWPAALGISLMSFTETVAAGRTFARHGDPRPVPDQELRALGIANMVGAFSQAMPAGGGTSQTAVNSNSGARTQVSQVVTLFVVLGVLLFLSPVIEIMPKATLAAVVVATTIGLLNPRDFQAIRGVRETEFWWGIAALVGVVLLGTLKGILVAVAISLVTLLYQANHPPLYVIGRKPGTRIYRPLSPKYPEDETLPGLLAVRTEGRMTFASVPSLGEKMWALIHKYEPRVLILEMSAVPDIEYTALQVMTEFEEKLSEAGIELWLAGLNPEPLELMRKAPLGEILGQERMFYNLNLAVQAFEKRGTEEEG